MKFLHEFSGVLGQFAMWSVVVAGIIVFKYLVLGKYLQIILPRKFSGRALFFNIHRIGSIFFIVFIALHYITTNKNNILLISGTIISLMSAVLIGLTFRLKRHFISSYQKIVYTKIGLFILGAVLVWAGHLLVDD